MLRLYKSNRNMNSTSLGTTILIFAAICCKSQCHFGVLRFGLPEDRDIGIGIFPECDEVEISAAGFGPVALYGVGAGEAELGECAQREIQYEAAVINQLLEFRQSAPLRSL